MSWRAQISRHIQELRFLACDTSQHSHGLRTWFRKNYEELKMLNPRTPFVYREGEEMDPFVYARYDWGNEEQVYVHDKTEAEITQVLHDLVRKGETMPKSPESDNLIPFPIIDADKGEDSYDTINLSWDGKVNRRNPEFDVPLEEATRMDEE